MICEADKRGNCSIKSGNIITQALSFFNDSEEVEYLDLLSITSLVATIVSCIVAEDMHTDFGDHNRWTTL